MSDNFNKINKEANSFWSKYITDLEETTSKSITDAYKSMSSSQKEAAKVQRDVSARVYDDSESAINNIKKSGIRNPSLSEFGNSLIWGIYNTNSLVENAKNREQRRDAGVTLKKLSNSLEELYAVIELGKETDAMFMSEYFGFEDSKNPGQPGGCLLYTSPSPRD